MLGLTLLFMSVGLFGYIAKGENAKYVKYNNIVWPGLYEEYKKRWFCLTCGDWYVLVKSKPIT